MSNGLPGPLRLTLYTLLAFAAAQQQLPRQDGYRNSPPELNQLTQPQKSINNQAQAQNLQHAPTSRKGKDTDPTRYHHFISSAKDERAVATLAPAGHIDPAVRARSKRTAAGPATAGLLPVRARELKDWEVENSVVLLATVDGSIYAVDRNTGKELWKFHSERPTVEISYANNPFKNYSGLGQPKDYMWFVEPKNGGSVYIHVPGVGGYTRPWGMTVKELANNSPYHDTETTYVYTAEQKNTLFTLNATDGTPLKYFSSAGGGGILDRDRNCRKVTKLLPDDDDECEETPTVNLGRTEYILNIATVTGETVCTIKYFEWTSNKRDNDLVLQYIDKSIDNKFIYPRHDGSVIALQHRAQAEGQDVDIRPKPLYQNHFASPVVQIFDVVKPQGADTRETPLVILPQAVAPVMNPLITENVFVNCTPAGSFYALSEMSYPSVTDGAKKAECYSHNLDSETIVAEDDMPLKSFLLTPHALVGIHSINEDLNQGEEHFPPRHLQIEGSSSIHTAAIDSKGDGLDYNQSIEQVSVPATSSQQGSLQNFFSGLNANAILSWLVIAALVFYQLHQAGIKLPWLSRKQALIEPRSIATEKSSNETTTTSTEPDEPTAGRRKVVTFAQDVIDEGAETGYESTAPTTRDSEAPIHGPYTEDGTAPVINKKKKAHRGSRGGRKDRPSNLKNKNKNRKNGDGDDVERIVDDLVTPEQGLQPDAEATNGNVTDVAGSMSIQSIQVDTTRVLGYGSGGTAVYEGTFEGREVAVKRMLLQYYDLASQEINLLSQSDDHPNVVRYFRHEKDKDFLYIAVERCQTSLWDLFREGMPMDGLAETQVRLLSEINSNMTTSLYQIAAGLRHLHSLRIIHRDIKPQNILVAYPKKNQTKGPRLVISDFGLCRMLQENASTLVGTAGNAGTIGWKAPEVIGQPRNGAGTQSSTQNDSNSGGSNSGEAGATPGVKRAVDIFSLGCVFYYVLTNGSHPFDDEEGDIGHVEREINIKKWDKPRLDKLSQWGDSTEEPRQLIEWMLSKQPENRPTAAEVMNHPFFWSDAKRLSFLCDVSDHWERECRDPPSAPLLILEDIGRQRNVHKGDFLAELDKCFIDSLGKQRKYTGDRMLDLLRALRNKKNHYADMDDFTKRKVGDLPSGYLAYWMRKFPALLMACYDAVRECRLEDDPRFKSYLEEAV